MSTGTRIILKKGSGEPDPLDLAIAELAVDVVNGDLYTKLQSSEVKNLTSGVDGGTGSSVHIGDTPPDSPEEGQQWMEVPDSGDATMWIYDSGNGGQWLQHPSGKDGADGVDGADGLWTDNGDTTISYSAGNVGIGTDEISGLSGKPTVHINDKAGNGAIRVGNSNSAGGNVFLDHSDANGARLRSNDTDMNIGAGPGNGINLFTGSSGETRLAIDATGDATFSGTVNASKLESTGGRFIGAGSGVAFSGDNMYPSNPDGTSSTGVLTIGTAAYPFKDAYFSGTVTTGRYDGGSTGVNIFSSGNIRLRAGTGEGSAAALVECRANTDKVVAEIRSNGDFVSNGSPLTRTRDLIETLSTLRASTLDESVDVRQALASACDKLIEKFEAMQSEAVTQEISDE